MNTMAHVPDWVALITALFVLIGALLTFIGTLGMLRLKSFYQRVHATTMSSTLGTGCILLASMLYFSFVNGRLVVHELLITFFMVVATPVTFLLLVRAVLYRDRLIGREGVPNANKHVSQMGKEENSSE